jgi:acetylornithine deacetylase/succinyl-diaminopimelate desuccinylase-like protein
MKYFTTFSLTVCLLVSITTQANSIKLSPGIKAASDIKEAPHAKKALEIYKKVISIRTVEGRGKVPDMVRYLATEFSKAGFPKKDIHIVTKGETAALVVRYRGDGSSNKKPILLLAHMDVVEALAKDWQRPPFELTQDDKYFYGRVAKNPTLSIPCHVQ